MARYQRDTEKDGRGRTPHRVLTATLVDPRVTPPASLKRTKIRFAARAKVLVPVMKMPKVRVAFALMVVTKGLAVGTIGFTHCPVEGFV